MASLLRVLSLSSRILPRSSQTLRQIALPSTSLLRNTVSESLQPCSYISTSKKNKDAVAVHHDTHSVTKHSEPEVLENLEEKEENWISYGYETVDRKEDAFTHHATLFVGITVCICFGGFVMAYYPDYKRNAWAQREAFLLLERREKEGLPLIDGNLIDPANIDLPEDGELGDFEIIV